MKAEDILRILFMNERLKRLPRTGWQMAGLSIAESEVVSSHVSGVSLYSFLISESLLSNGIELDLGRVLAISTIHDLPEAITSDIPFSTEQVLGSDFIDYKSVMETEAMHQIEQGCTDQLSTLFDEYNQQNTIEARIVRAADVLDMLTHALSLERRGFPASRLDDFFTSGLEKITDIDIPITQEIFELLALEHKRSVR